MKKSGGKKFTSLTLSKEDAHLKQEQKDAKKNAKEEEEEEKENTKVIFHALQQYGFGLPSIYNTTIEESEMKNYLKLYEAIYGNDMNTVEKLCTKPQIGKQLHVSVSSNSSNRTPLMLAIQKGHDDLAVRILEISFEQYTPLPVPKKLDDKKSAPLINNYELGRLMDKIKVLVCLFFFFMDEKLNFFSKMNQSSLGIS